MLFLFTSTLLLWMVNGVPVTKRATAPPVSPRIHGTSKRPLNVAAWRRSALVGPSFRSRLRSPSTWKSLVAVGVPLVLPGLFRARTRDARPSSRRSASRPQVEAVVFGFADVLDDKESLENGDQRRAGRDPLRDRRA